MRETPSVNPENKCITAKHAPVTVKTKNHDAPKRRGNGCLLCGKRGHNVRFCYFRMRQYERAWRLNLCHIEPNIYGHVWIVKRALYPNYKERTEKVSHTEPVASHTETEHNLISNMARVHEEPVLISHVAYTSTKHNNLDSPPWYFDSECSRHMTGNQDYLDKLQCVKGGKVTFGDGGQGKICGVEVTERADLPRLINVYFVDGLKANLITVSQFCDEGLEVIFNSKECRAVDAKGNLVLCGVRSGNNCYMWNRQICVSLLENQNLIYGTRNLAT